MKAEEKGQCPGKGEMLLSMCRSKGGRDDVDAGGLWVWDGQLRVFLPLEEGNKASHYLRWK